MDVGTGSGCLAIALALECPEAEVFATDTSEGALAVARENARRHGVADRIAFSRGAFLAAVQGPIDLIVANPPYVAERDRHTLPRELVAFEPADALFAGPDGLDAIRGLLPLAAAELGPHGRLILEIGQGQLRAVRDLASATTRLRVERTQADLQGIPRVLVIG